MHLMVDYLFTTFFHKISGNSLNIWIKDIHKFRKILNSRLCKPPTMEAERWLHAIKNNNFCFYEIHTDFDYFRF